MNPDAPVTKHFIAAIVKETIGGRNAEMLHQAQKSYRKRQKMMCFSTMFLAQNVHCFMLLAWQALSRRTGDNGGDAALKRHVCAASREKTVVTYESC